MDADQQQDKSGDQEQQVAGSGETQMPPDRDQ